jgi:hypothetical protein
MKYKKSNYLRQLIRSIRIHNNLYIPALSLKDNFTITQIRALHTQYVNNNVVKRIIPVSGNTYLLQCSDTNLNINLVNTLRK